MKINDKIVLAHSGFFSKEAENLYRENSIKVCSISTRKKYVKIIELDVRKSKDGVLYCYHGNFIQYHFFLKFPMNLIQLKKRYHVDTLEDILKVITRNKIVCLDIKDKNITKEDIIKAVGNKQFKEIIIGNKSVRFLKRFDKMPKKFVKILNGNIFCNFYNLKKLKEDNFKYFEVVFPFQISKKNIERAVKKGLEFRCAGMFFLSKKEYLNKIDKYKIKHISSDFV